MKVGDYVKAKGGISGKVAIIYTNGDIVVRNSVIDYIITKFDIISVNDELNKI